MMRASVRESVNGVSSMARVGVCEEKVERSALNADAARSVVGGVSSFLYPPTTRGTSHVLPPRVLTSLVLLAIGLILVMGVKDTNTSEGWSAWAMVPALVMYAVAAWLLRVECRDPWDGGTR